MNSHTALSNRTARRVLPGAGAAALALALMVALPQSAHAAQVTPPLVPVDVQVPAGNRAFLVGHATGTQNYVCVPSGATFAFVLFTPEATLFNDHFKQLTTHFFSPNPFENGTVRATWQHSRDTSTVWGKVTGSSTDPNFVTPGAIAWLRVEQTGRQEGPSGGDTLAVTTFIQRLNTEGGSAPATGCSQLADVGKKVFVPYTADYFFYKAADGDDDDLVN
jgi:hypothetical protein